MTDFFETKQTRNAKKKRAKRLVRLYWVCFSSCVVFVFCLFCLAAVGAFGEMPSLELLENPETNLATEILDEEGAILGKIYLDENRTPLDYEELSPALVQALVATEDERFFDHSGIDVIGGFRALFFLGTRGGGSTISQQLARQLFVGTRSRNKVSAVIQKVKEWVIAIRIERNYTKQEILAMYFNVYDFNNQADGIRSAAHIYFGKDPNALSLEEAATLVGMFKNSSLYNPLNNPEGVRARRNTVLLQMYKNNIIDEKQRDSLSALPLVIDFHPETHDQGLATYFREEVRMFMKKWVEENPKPDGSKYNLYKDGLRVYTTINKKMQEYAEYAVVAHLKSLQKEFNSQLKNRLIIYDSFPPFVGIDREDYERLKEGSIRRSERWRHMKEDLGKSEKEIFDSFDKKEKMRIFSWNGDIDTIMTPLDSMLYYKKILRAGMLSIEPQTGHIKTWVGGANYRHFKYDQVSKGARQAGSTFKPFLYAAAIDQLGLTPCSQFRDVIHCIEANKYGNPEPWCPNNSTKEFTGKMKTLKEALAKSINSISIALMDEVGPRSVVDLITRMGITSETPPVPSIALGTVDVKLLEMVGAYSTFSNKGVYIKPYYLLRIEDKNGTILYEPPPPVIRDVFSEKVSYSMISLMKGVTDFGSGKRLKTVGMSNYIYKNVMTGYPYELKNPIAGKTGTSQNQSDGWFIGSVPNLVTGVWVGAEDRAVHFKSLSFGQGATTALPIWGLFMKSCYADASLNVSKRDFERPKGMNIDLECEDAREADSYDDEDESETPDETTERGTKKDVKKPDESFDF